MASVFVRNLPFGVTQEELEHVFSEIGPVRKIDVIKDKGKRKSEMLTRGFAFVKFAVESDAAVAVEKLNKTDFQGRKMLIDYAMEKGKRRGLPGKEKPATDEPKQDEKEQEDVPMGQPALPDEVEKATQERKAAKEARRAAKAAQKAAKAEAKAKKETEEIPIAAELEEKTEPKQEPKVELSPAAPAADSAASSSHVQSERNARRRQHREFLRDVERRKEEEASVEQKSVLVFGLGADVTQKHVLKKVKKVGAVAKVELKEETRTGKTYALVQFKTTKDAALAVAKLDHHIFKGSVLQVKIAAKAVVVDDKEAAGKPGLPKRAVETEGLRLIVRNLAFQTTDTDLEKLFEVHGPLFEVRVVRMPVEEDTKESEEADGETNAEPVLGRSRGFGFVQYRDVADARAAVEKLNGTKLKGREMIVDFALSKTKYLEQQKKHEEEAVAATEGDEEDEEANSGDEDEDQLEMATDGEAGAGSEDSDEEDGEEEEEEEEAASAPREDTEAQRDRTLFIRNLSFQTSEDGLREFFQAFGAVEYARVVYEKGSGLSKGVGFVRFKSAEVAAEVLKRGEQPQGDEKKKHKKDKKKKDKVFTLSALAAGGDDALTLDGRQLLLSRAVSKTDAEHLADSNARERRRLDKRNLYLAYEGTLNVNKMADAELELPKMDIDKRRRAIREKKLKLQNPMYFVSPMRLSVRNLSTALDDRKLKKLFHDAASAGVCAGNVDRTEIKPELLPKGNPPVKVRMAKVVRDMESAKAGKDPRSRGYGFVEFSEHLHALAALRILNNNPKYTSYAAGRGPASGAPDSTKSRLIVEFALENHGKLKLREKRAADAAKKREEERALQEAQGEDGDDAEKAKKSRGQRQREKKKLRSQAKAEAKAETDQGKTQKSKKTAKVEKVVKQQLKKRKRVEPPRGDAADDALASLETAHMAKKGKTLSRSQRKHAKELEKEKSFDEMVRSYKKKIFGEKPVVAKGDDSTKNSDRWFD
ncbi:hypothetical protein PInf_009720 [Phytophthora infestans]|nr:hypothetical protein PInf_009720 [Phytophthora infestans]